MRKRTGFPRILLFLALLTGLAGGFITPGLLDEPVSAAPLNGIKALPLAAVDELTVVISEFRFRGPNGPDDEFIEIYNATGSPVPIGDWIVKKSSGCGLTETQLIKIPAGKNLNPGQYYLIGKKDNYSGSTSADLEYTTAGIADDGGIALFKNGTDIVDQAGLCNTTKYKEGTTLSPLNNSVEQSYERKAGGDAGNCKDTDNNSTDFTLNSSSSIPQNSSSLLLPCIVVTNVSADISYNQIYTDTVGGTIDIDVDFSNNVNVTGMPKLLLETGPTDRYATYSSGSGSSTLTFQYNIMTGDTAGDLDYVSANALSLNGGTITGAVGDASLVLPKPGTGSIDAGSLSINNDIKINTGSNPSVISIKRQNPTAEITNANVLVFRVTFSEGVQGVDIGDFDATGTTGDPTKVTLISSEVYDIEVSGGDLLIINNYLTVGLFFSGGQNITDADGNLLTSTVPTSAPPETYTVDNISPTVTIKQSVGQIDDPTEGTPVIFDVVFNEEIDISTFSISDVTQSGAALGVVWSIADSGDHMNFTLYAILSGNGIIKPSIAANKVNDVAGNGNTVSISGGDDSVELDDSVEPTVTINQELGQSDPTGLLPVNFTVVFSEAINASLFTVSDITQTGTATGVSWSITNSGDYKTFTLSAVSTTGYGTIIPSIAINRVTDGAGNNNAASTSTDNSVNYILVTNAPRAVVINEVAWAGTGSGLSDDEWIELYNPGSTAINISGWKILAADGEPNITIPVGKSIPAGGYFLLERDNDNTVSDIAADMIYTGALSNSGERLTLYDASLKVIDTANGNGGSWPKGSSSTYGTMERIGTSTESDSSWQTNNGTKKNGKDADGDAILGTPKNANTPGISVSSTSTSVPTSTPLPPTATIDPRLLINEVLARPGFDWNGDGRADVYDEFIEIKNVTPVDVSLSGWKIDNGIIKVEDGRKVYTLPGTIILKPGERIAIYSADSNFLLSDAGAYIRLLNPKNVVYDEYKYDLARTEDRSFCRIPDGGYSVQAWYEDCTPTPKLSNTREGSAPSMIGDYQSPVCNLPDTIPADFFIAECRGRGANIWNDFFWDEFGWFDELMIPDPASKWDSFIK